MTRTPILPPLRRTAADAERFARVVHANQVDKAGRPYVEHLERVDRKALLLAPDDWHNDELDTLGQVAWLHDVIEDANVIAAGLLLRGYRPYVIGCIGWLTKARGEPYAPWIAAICERAPLPSRIVKLADMEDSADPERLALLPEDVRARLTRKYELALAMLRAAVERGTGR